MSTTNHRLISGISLLSSVIAVAFSGVSIFSRAIAKDDYYDIGVLDICEHYPYLGPGFSSGGGYNICYDTTSSDNYISRQYAGYSKAAQGMQAGLFILFALSILTFIMHSINCYYKSRILFLSTAIFQLLSVIGGLTGMGCAIAFHDYYYKETKYSHSFALLILAWIINAITGTILIILYRKSPPSLPSSSGAAAAEQDRCTNCCSCKCGYLSTSNPITLLKIIGVIEFILFVLCIASLADPSIGTGSSSSNSSMGNGAGSGRVGQSSNSNYGLFRFCSSGSQSYSTSFGGSGTTEFNDCDKYQKLTNLQQAAQAFGILSVLFISFIIIMIAGYFLLSSFRSSAIYLHSIFITGLFTLLWSLIEVAVIAKLVSDWKLTPGASFGLFIVEFLGQIVCFILLYFAYQQLIKSCNNNNNNYNNNNNNKINNASMNNNYVVSYNNPALNAGAGGAPMQSFYPSALPPSSPGPAPVVAYPGYNNNIISNNNNYNNYNNNNTTASSVPPPFIQCTSCYSSYPSNTKFCGKCGQQLSQTIIHCKQCTTPIVYPNRFCGSCGAASA